MLLVILFQIQHYLGQVQREQLILARLVEQVPNSMVVLVKHQWTLIELIVNKANAHKRYQVYIAVMLKSQPQNARPKAQQMVLVAK